MFSNKSVNSKVLAVAFVSMLMLCSFGMMLSEESDAVNDETFDLYMKVDDQFTYEPKVNLDNTTISASGAVTNGVSSTANQLSWKDKDTNGYTDLYGSFSTASNTAYTVTVSANWQSNTSPVLTQNSTQTINFHVYDRVTFADASKYGNYTAPAQSFAAASLTAGQVIDTVEVDALIYDGALTFGTPTIKFNDGTDNGAFVWDSTNHQIKVASDITSENQVPYGEYTVTVPVSYNGTHLQDEAVYTLDITVAENITITNDSKEIHTYVEAGAEYNSYTIQTNYDNQAGTITSYNVQAESGYESLIQWTSGATFTVNVSEEATSQFFTDKGSHATPGDKQTQSITFDVTVTAYGNIDGHEGDESGSATISVTIYNSLYFLDEPKITQPSVQSATGNPQDILASANFLGTEGITYNWGDGTTTHVTLDSTNGSKLSARHVYANPGMYAITMTADNDNGSQRAILLYNANNGYWAEGDEEDIANGEKSFFEEHGILFLIFAILAIVMFALFFFGFLAPYTLIAGFILVIAAVACFLGADFGITEGLIEDLNI